MINPPLLYLGTHEATWIATEWMPPLFVTRSRLEPRKRLPVGRCAGLAVDSGGFTELTNHGRWTITPQQYVDFVMRLVDAYGSRLHFAAPMDWLCAPRALQMTGRDVDYHMNASVESVVELRSLLGEHGGVISPTLQGATPGDYVRCIDLFAGAGVDLFAERTVTVGSLVRGAGSLPMVVEILRAVTAAGLGFHALGLKGDVLLEGFSATAAERPGGGRVGLTSADSTTWSFVARRRQIRLDGCSHGTCGNCRVWAQQWWQQQIGELHLRALSVPQRLVA